LLSVISCFSINVKTSSSKRCQMFAAVSAVTSLACLLPAPHALPVRRCWRRVSKFRVFSE
jgi:hypothetical protein